MYYNSENFNYRIQTDLIWLGELQSSGLWYKVTEQNALRMFLAGDVTQGLQTFRQIVGENGTLSDISHFEQATTGKPFGFFVVPPKFYEMSGMNFFEYLSKLYDDDDFFETDTGEIEQNIRLPDWVANLKDDDLVEITVDDEENVTIRVIQPSGTPGGDGSGNCHCDDCLPDYSGILWVLGLILHELRSIAESIDILLWGDYDEETSTRKPWWQRIAEGVGGAIGSIFSTGGEFIGNVADGVGSAIGSIFGGAGDIVSGIAEGVGSILGGLFNGEGIIAAIINLISEIVALPGIIILGISDIISGVIGAIGDVVSSIAALSGAIISGISDIISSVVSAIGNVVSSIAALPGAILSGIGSIIGGISSVLGSILSFLETLIESVTTLFLALFVPSEGFFERSFGGLQTRFEAKIPILGQSKTVIDNFTAMAADTTAAAPEFTVEMYGVKANLIDFSQFAPFMPTIHGIIIAVVYIAFIRKVIKKIPSIIGGFH
jgi:hypothetical protein